MLWTDKVKKYLLKLNIVELKDKQFTVINIGWRCIAKVLVSAQLPQLAGVPGPRYLVLEPGSGRVRFSVWQGLLF